MRFKRGSQPSAVSRQDRVKCVLCLVQIMLCIFVSTGTLAHAEVLERIVAIVNDDVILLSELEEALRDNERSGRETAREKVLDNLVNKVLLLEQAKRFRIDKSGPYGEIKEDDRIVDEYIEKRIKATIHIPYEKMEAYHAAHEKSYGDKKFYEVKDEIESHLIDRELEKQLSEHIAELRERAYIRIQLQ